MYVYPKPGVLTRDPVKKDLLPESGRAVADMDPFWLRRIADGDVLKGTPPPPAKTSSKKTSGSEAA